MLNTNCLISAKKYFKNYKSARIPGKNNLLIYLYNPNDDKKSINYMFDKNGLTIVSDDFNSNDKMLLDFDKNPKLEELVKLDIEQFYNRIKEFNYTKLIFSQDKAVAYINYKISELKKRFFYNSKLIEKYLPKFNKLVDQAKSCTTIDKWTIIVKNNQWLKYYSSECIDWNSIGTEYNSELIKYYVGLQLASNVILNRQLKSNSNY